MNYPAIFFKKTKTSENDYDFNSNNTLDVGRLIQGAGAKPYMRKRGLRTVLEKKALVFADWTIVGWSLEKIEQVRILIGKMRKEGFSIFIILDERAEPLTEWDPVFETGDSGTRTRKRVSALAPARVNKLMEEACQFNPGHIMILDWHWINVLNGQIPATSPRRLEIADIVKSEIPVEEILPALQENLPKLKTILHSEFSSESNRIAARLQKEALLPIQTEYQFLSLTLDEATAMLAGESELAGSCLHADDWQRIKKIRFFLSAVSFSPDTLNAFIKRFPNFESLTLTGNAITQIIWNSPLHLASAKHLKIKNIHLKKESLRYILTEASKLESLVLEGENFDLGNSQGDYRLPGLQVLRIQGDQNLTSKKLQGLLANSKNLRALILSQEYIDIDDFYLPLLEILNVPMIRVSPKMLEKRSGTLEFLSMQFDGCNPARSLNALKTLCLSDDVFPLFKFQDLLSKSPGLKSFSLKKCTISDGHAQNLVVPPLENLDLEGSTMSGRFLQYLLSGNSKINSLNLKYCTINGEPDPDNTRNVSLPETLDLTGTTLSASCLQFLLSRVKPGLRSLNLKSCIINNQSDPERWNNINLKALEWLDLSEASLPASILEALLDKEKGACPGFLEMDECSISDVALEKPLNTESLISLELSSAIDAVDLGFILDDARNMESLLLHGPIYQPRDTELVCNTPKLKDLDLSGSNLSTKTLEKILSSTKNLEYLSLMACTLTGLMTEPQSLPHLRTLVLPAVIPGQTLGCILGSAAAIKEFSFDNINIQGSLGRKLHLPNLEKITLSGEFSGENLEYFLANSKKLRVLDSSYASKIIPGIQGALHLPNLVHMDPPQGISARDIGYLMQDASDLETLVLYSQEILENLAFDLMPDFQKLRTLDLRRTKISAYNLQGLLRISLVKLALKDCEIVGALSKPQDLSNLIELELPARISAKNLEYCLINAVSLKTLVFNHTALSGEMKRDLNLAGLTELYFSEMEISANHLQRLLAHAKNLRSLALVRCIVTGEIQEELFLNNLESLHVTNTEMTAKILQSILKNSTRIQTLHLLGTRIKGDMDYALPLENIKNLTPENEITAKTLQMLLINMQNLLSLDLSKATITGTFSRDLHFSKLDRLFLPQRISTENLEKILIDAKSLTSLYCHGGEIEGDPGRILSLENLKFFVWEALSIPAIYMQWILSKANHLLSVSLQCDEIEGDLEDLPLSRLTSLHLPQKISGKNLEKLLINASKLEKLDFSSRQLAGNIGCALSLAALDSLDIRNSMPNTFFYQNLRMPNLKKLELPVIIASSSVKLLLNNAPNLELLDLRQRTIVEDVFKPYCDLRSSHLKTLNIEGASLQQEFLDFLSSRIKRLEILKDQATIIRSSQQGVCRQGGQRSANVDAAHDPKNLLDQKPKAKDFCFVWNAGNQTKNQQMIFEKLCMYLIQKEKNLEYIPKINDGICLALSHLFQDKSITDWEKMVDSLLQWDPSTTDCDSRLASYFEEIYRYFIKYYASVNSCEYRYLGGRLNDFLAVLRQDCLLSNPWHAIALKYSGSCWMVYDPNFADGYKLLYPKDLPAQIQHCLGAFVCVENTGFITNALEKCAPQEILDKNAFIRDGGLLILCRMPPMEAAALVKAMIGFDFSPAALQQGLFIRATNGFPACYPPLHRNSQTATFVSDLLEQFKKMPGSKEMLKKNDQHIAAMQKQEQENNPNKKTAVSEKHGNKMKVSGKRNTDAMQSTDADIRYKKEPFDLDLIFAGHDHNPHPVTYRLSVFNKLSLNTEAVDPEQAFLLHNQDCSIRLQKSRIKEAREDLVQKFRQNTRSNRFYGKVCLDLDARWQALPSLSAHEKLLQYHLDTPGISCEIAWSNRDSLYYIRSSSKNTAGVIINFLLEIDPDKTNQTRIPVALEKLIDNYRNFGIPEDEMLLPASGMTGRQYLDRINTEKKGACRHRAIALMDAIARGKITKSLDPEIECRYLDNDCHAWVEIRLNSRAPWLTYNLGGYPAELEINNKSMVADFAEQPLKSSPEFSMENHKFPSESLPEFRISLEPEKPRGETWLQLSEKLVSSPLMSMAKFGKKAPAPHPSQTPDSRVPGALEISIEAFHKIWSREYFASRFETWKVKKANNEALKSFCERLVQGEQKKLIKTRQVKQHILALERHCQHIGRPFYSVNSPDDLICSSPWVEKNSDNRGKLHAGPGGPLFHFLQRHRDPGNPPLLVLNLNNFNADDIVANNSLFDREAKVDGTDCGHAVIVAVMDPESPNAYSGSDLSSRFHFIENRETPETELPLPMPWQEDSGIPEKFVINLAHAEDWKERLMGRWIIKKDQLHFEDGLLGKALKSGLVIDIQNALWENEAFSHFWDRAFTLGSFDPLNPEMSFPEKPVFIQSEGYAWEDLRQYVDCDDVFKVGNPVINPSLLNQCFYRYRVEEGLLDTGKGFIEAHAGGALHLNLSADLSEDDWASLLIACKAQRVKLHCHCAPGVSIPEMLHPVTKTGFRLPAGEDVIIQSSDPEVSIACFTQNAPWHVIEVSELTSNDLLKNRRGKIGARLHPENGQKENVFVFEEKDGVLIMLLSAGKQVILKGHFSPELADAMAPFLLERQAGKPGGRLKIVTSDASNLNYMPVESHEVSLEERKTALEKAGLFGSSATREKALMSALDLTQSFNHCRAKRVHPGDPWQGLKGLSGGILLEPVDFANPEQIRQKSEAFVCQRLEDVNGLLEKSPFVFLTGLTGVGKSTFVEKYLVAERDRLYVGENRMLDWIQSEATERKLLFIDEANITSRQWSEFDGLFQTPSHIVFDGELHPLSKNHKVIFAGNPLNYGGERKMSPLFSAHGNAIIFNPMPQAFIYEVILKPLFSETELENQALEISREILRVYQFICQCSRDEVLISPRELQMMALLILSGSKSSPSADPGDLTRYYTRFIAQRLVPEKNRAEFRETFGDAVANTAVANRPSDFALTASREPLWRYLSELLNLRKYRCENETRWNTAKRHGGLGGIIIEGEPGIGKSEILIALLHAQEIPYEEVGLDTTILPSHGNVFYRMPVSMSLDDKKNLLLKAFHQGAIVIMDEINSSPMMERFLNDLLMGKTPEGKPADKPGFMIWGTQNPCTMNGRYPLPMAVARRMFQYSLERYPREELIAIEERNFGLAHQKSAEMTEAFESQTNLAKEGNYAPTPTVRDLFHTAEHCGKAWQVLQEKIKVTQSSNSLF